MMIARLAVTLALVFAGGCISTRTTFDAPREPTPDAWREAARAPGDRVTTDRWWEHFGDADLDALVARVLADNHSLAAAALRAQQAQVQARLAWSDQRPQLYGGASTAASRPLDASTTHYARGAGISIAYVVDLWNRLGAIEDAARWEATASAEDHAAVELTLISTAVLLHFQLGYIEDQLQLDDMSIETARRTSILIEARYAAGAASSLEVAQTNGTLLSLQSDRTERIRLRTQTRNALGLLLGGPDLSNYQGGSPTMASLPILDAGVPAQLVARRPDLRAAEARLRALLAMSDAAAASFYPSLTLTGDVTSSSEVLRAWFSHPVGTLAATLTLPMLNPQRTRLTREAARIDYDAAVRDFRSTLQTAYAEVENALSAQTHLLEQQSLLGQSLQAARSAERIYEIRYRAGAVALSDWLDAQEKRRSVEAALLQNRRDQVVNHVALCRALGGDARRQTGAIPKLCALCYKPDI